MYPLKTNCVFCPGFKDNNMCMCLTVTLMFQRAHVCVNQIKRFQVVIPCRDRFETLHLNNKELKNQIFFSLFESSPRNRKNVDESLFLPLLLSSPLYCIVFIFILLPLPSHSTVQPFLPSPVLSALKALLSHITYSRRLGPQDIYCSNSFL